jgi:hypothetical protein
MESHESMTRPLKNQQYSVTFSGIEDPEMSMPAVWHTRTAAEQIPSFRFARSRQDRLTALLGMTVSWNWVSRFTITS